MLGGDGEVCLVLFIACLRVPVFKLHPIFYYTLGRYIAVCYLLLNKHTL